MADQNDSENNNEELLTEKSAQTPEEFYISLAEKLTNHHNFPEDYLFKFIFPNEQKKMMQLFQVFDKLKYSITTRESKNGKYVSASLVAFVLDAKQVTDIYQEAAKIDKMMML